MVREIVREFVELGPLPDSLADEPVIARHQAALMRITRPVSVEEAAQLLGCFGPDDCYGLAWTLLHLIESAPGGAPLAGPPDTSNEWLQRLWARAHR